MKGKYTKLKLKNELLREARVLGMHRGEVELMLDKVADEVDEWVTARAQVTEADMDRVISAKLRKYNKDLAYWYKNRNKIV